MPSGLYANSCISLKDTRKKSSKACKILDIFKGFVIIETKIACEASNNEVSNHIPDIRKMIDMPKRSKKK